MLLNRAFLWYNNNNGEVSLKDMRKNSAEMRRIMKKRWISALALAMSVALLGACGAKEGQNGKEDGNVSQESGAAQNASGQEDGGSTSETEINVADYVTLGEYKGLTVDIMPEDEYIEIRTKQFYFEKVSAEEGVTDRPVENLDMTNIDYEGKKDGVAFEGGTARNQTLLIGSNQFIDGFEEGLIGVMPGETVDLNLTFPEKYGNSELAGQAVVFTVTVNFIAEMQESNVAGLGLEGVTTLEELRGYIRDYGAHTDYLNEFQSGAMNQVMASSVFSGELPEALVEKSRKNYAELFERQAAAYGMDGKSYIEMYGMDYESTLDDYAEQYVRQLLVVRAIAEKEGLNLSDSDFEARLEEAAKAANVTVEQLLVNGLTKEDYRESFLFDDVTKFVVENTVNAVK